MLIQKSKHIIVIILTLIISFLCNAHDFDYSINVNDKLQKRDNYYNTLFWLQLIIISFASEIQEINSALIIHLALTIILISTIRFGVPYYNKVIQKLETIGLFIHFVFVLITLGFYNINGQDKQNKSFILTNIQQQTSIAAVYIIMIPILVKLSQKVVNNIEQQYNLQVNMKSNNPIIVDNVLRNWIGFVNHMSVGSYIDQMQGIKQSELLGQHFAYCEKVNCICQDIQTQKDGMTDWQFISDQECRTQFSLSILKLELEESLKKKENSQSFLIYTYMMFLIEVYNNPIKCYCELMIMQKLITLQNNIKDLVYLEIIKLKADLHYNFFLKSQNNLMLDNVIEFDDKLELYVKMMKEFILLYDELNIYQCNDFINLETIEEKSQAVLKKQNLLNKLSKQLFKLNCNNKTLQKLYNIHLNLINCEKTIPVEQMIQKQNIQYQKDKDILIGSGQDDEINGEKQQDEIKVKNELVKNKIDIFDPQSCVIEISLQKPAGQILKISSQFSYIFGYKNDDIINKNCSILMPYEYALNHDLILGKFIDNVSFKQMLRINEMEVFGITKSCYILRLNIIARASQVTPDSFGLIGYLKLVAGNKVDYILFEQGGKISYTTKNLCKQLMEDRIDYSSESIESDEDPNKYRKRTRKNEKKNQLCQFNIEAIIPNIGIEYEKEKLSQQLVEAILVIPKSEKAIRLFQKYKTKQHFKRLINKLNLIDFNYYNIGYKLGKDTIYGDKYQLYIQIQYLKLIGNKEIICNEMSKIIQLYNDQNNVCIKTLDFLQQSELIGTSFTMTTFQRESEGDNSMFKIEEEEKDQVQNNQKVNGKKEKKKNQQKQRFQKPKTLEISKNQNFDKDNQLMINSSQNNDILFHEQNNLESNQENLQIEQQEEHPITQIHNINNKRSTLVYNQNLELNKEQFLEQIQSSMLKNELLSNGDYLLTPKSETQNFLEQRLNQDQIKKMESEQQFDRNILTINEEKGQEVDQNKCQINDQQINKMISQTQINPQMTEDINNNNQLTYNLVLTKYQGDIISPLIEENKMMRFNQRDINQYKFKQDNYRIQLDQENQIGKKLLKNGSLRKNKNQIEKDQSEENTFNKESYQYRFVMQSLTQGQQINLIRQLGYVSVLVVALLFMINAIIYSIILQGWDHQLYLIGNLTIGMRTRIFYSMLIKQRSISDLYNINAFKQDVLFQIFIHKTLNLLQIQKSIIQQEVIKNSQLIIEKLLNNYVGNINQMAQQSSEKMNYANYFRNDTVLVKISDSKGVIYKSQRMLRLYYIIYSIQAMKYYVRFNDIPSKQIIIQNFALIYGIYQDSFDISYSQIQEKFDEILLIQEKVLIVISIVSFALLSLLFPIYYVIQINREQVLKLFTTITQQSLDLLSERLRFYYYQCSNQNLKQKMEKKKKSISSSSVLQKFPVYISIIALFGFILISIYPLINYLLVASNITNGQLNTDELYNLYWPLAQLSSNYAANYDQIQNKLNTGSLLRVTQTRLEQLYVTNQKEIQRLNKLLGNYNKERYNQELYQQVLAKILTQDICEVINENPYYFSRDLFNYTECKFVGNGILKKGLILSLAQIYEIYQQLLTSYELTDNNLFISKILNWSQTYQVQDLEKIFNIIYNLIESLRIFLRTQNHEYFNYISQIQLWLFIYSIFSLICIFIGWRVLFKKWTSSFAQTHQSLKLLPIETIIGNSYIMAYLTKDK